MFSNQLTKSTTDVGYMKAKLNCLVGDLLKISFLGYEYQNHVINPLPRPWTWPPKTFPDSKVYEANMGPTWVLSAPDGPHVVPMNLVIRVCMINLFTGRFQLQQAKPPCDQIIYATPLQSLEPVWKLYATSLGPFNYNLCRSLLFSNNELCPLIPT